MMHKITTALTLCLFSLISTQLATAQAPTEEAQQRTTNQLATEAMREMLQIFEAAANANSPDSAHTAVTQINAHTDRLAALTPLLAKSKKPTNAEMRQFAEFVYKNNAQIRASLKRIAVLKESNTAETNKLIKTAMDNMSSKTQSLTSKMNRLYPTKKMKTYIKEVKDKKEQ